MKDDSIGFLEEFHENGRLVRGSNNSFIVLNPKKDNPQKVSDFRPISLIGCMYKVLSKVLANRLRKVIASLISETQSAFIRGRQILDGILVANEVVDDAKRGKKEAVFFKVDFEKAYDSVNWEFLEFMMNKMGFVWKWRKRIMECISTPLVSVLVNGSPTEEFRVGRGLRQGDPLSPFLFLIVAEGLNLMLKEVVGIGCYEGYKVGDLSITHLQFADDTLLVGEKSSMNIWSIKAVLQLFQSISGLKVNFYKSRLIGVNVEERWLEEAASFLNCKIGVLPFIYLGLPIGADGRKKRCGPRCWKK